MQRGSITNDVVFPTLRDFLRITQLSKYEGKLKKQKCAETEDLKNLAGRVGFLHVEEQRVKRYLDYFHNKTLVQHEAKQQPITLENFFTLAKLPNVQKSIKKFGVVEFDDLPWMAYADRAALLPKPVELNRFVRYFNKILNSPDIGTIEEAAASNTRNLQTFIEEAKLKSHKSLLEKLGVVETDDLQHLNRSDLSKLKQVEFERFVRYREKYSDLNNVQTSTSLEMSPVPTQIGGNSAPQFPSPNQNQTFNFSIQGEIFQNQHFPPQQYPLPQQPPFPVVPTSPHQPMPGAYPELTQPAVAPGWYQQQSFDQYPPVQSPNNPMFPQPPYNPHAPPALPPRNPPTAPPRP